MSAAGRRRALLISENAPVPADRRVWNEARTLSGSGWDVTVVAPRDPDGGQAPSEMLEGIAVHRYPLRPAGGAAGYAREYGQALWRIRALVRELQRERGFDVVHAANPPDFLLLAARGARARGARLVFDHHDLTPELFRSRFGRGGLPHRALLAIERRALRSADVVISTNESYRRIAIGRGGVDPERVFVVRNGPDLERFRPVAPDPSLRRGRPHLLAYVGVMGPQDGIDHALRALAALRELRGEDWHAVFAGEGEVRPAMEGLARELGIGELVEFAGWCGDEQLRGLLSSADVCLEPDPPSPLNDLSTMIKVPEYMAMGRPIAAYDLRETRVSAGPAAAYAEAPEPAALGRCVNELLEDPERRERMGRAGRERVAELSWERSAKILLAAYERALAGARGAVVGALCLVLAGALGSCGSSGEAAGAGTVAGARLIARTVDRRDPFVNGRLLLIDAGGRRRAAGGGLECERVAYGEGHGLCLAAEENGEPAHAVLFDSGLDEVGTLPLEGMPTQATVSADGRYGAMTVTMNANVEPGDEQGGASTATTIVDMRSGKPLAQLDDFKLRRGGRPFAAAESRVSGVTFAPGGDHLYATVDAGGTLYLAEGSLKAKTLRLLRAGVDAPSISPDGRRLAYRAHRREDDPGRLEVLDLKTMRVESVAEHRQIAEQPTWLGDHALVYSDGFDVYTVPVGGHGSPRVVLPNATSPVAPGG